MLTVLIIEVTNNRAKTDYVPPAGRERLVIWEDFK